MAPQPAGAAPIQPFPTLTVQTFLYPDRTIKPNSMERSLGNSLQREREGCCQKSRKRRQLLHTPRPPCKRASLQEDSAFSVVGQGWTRGPHLCYCPSACPPLQKTRCAPSLLLHHAGHCTMESKRSTRFISLFRKQC